MYLKLDAIQELANKFFLPFDIAEIIEVDVSEFVKELNDPYSDIRRAFYKGYLAREKTIRDEIFSEKDTNPDSNAFLLKEINTYKTKLAIQLYEA